ncbi:MAG TPA: YbaY family lipoprotein [Myxococcaceae bacterium]
MDSKPPASTPGEGSTAPGTTQPAPQPQASMEVTGSVFYRERVALTPAAVLQVEVVESGGQAGAETVVAQQTYTNPGQVPLRFSVTVPGERIRPEATYLIRARITDGSRTFSAAQAMPVLTQGNPHQDVQVLVRSGG